MSSRVRLKHGTDTDRASGTVSVDVVAEDLAQDALVVRL
jgi:hypothetical protein